MHKVIHCLFSTLFPTDGDNYILTFGFVFIMTLLVFGNAHDSVLSDVVSALAEYQVTNPDIPQDVLNAVKSVDAIFRGIGLPTLLHYICHYAQKSLMTIGSMGAGKGAVKTMLHIEPAVNVDLDSVTKTDLSKRIGKAKRQWIHINIEEVAALSEYQKNILQTIIAKVITDGTYISESSKIFIEECKMTVFAGIQPLTFSQMIAQNPMWESITNDRFLKILLVNTLRNDDVDRFDIREEDILAAKKKLNALFRLDPKKVKVDEIAIVEVRDKIIRSQIAGGRAHLYSRELLQSWGSCLNKEHVTIDDADLFIKMFGFYFASFSTFTSRSEVEGKLQFKGGLTATFIAIAMNQRFDYTKSDYETIFQVSESSIRKNVSELIDMRMVKAVDRWIQTRAGKRKAVVYTVAGKVQEFHDFYESLLA